MTGQVQMSLAIVLGMALWATAANRDDPALVDPVEKSVKILESAARDAPTLDERVRLTKALNALKANAKPVKALDVGKKEALQEGDLTYGPVGATRNDAGLWRITVRVTNTSDTEIIRRDAWHARIAGSTLTDDTGRPYLSSSAIMKAGDKLGPGASTEYEFSFSGVPAEKAREFYFDLPRQPDRAAVTFVITRSVVGKSPR